MSARNVSLIDSDDTCRGAIAEAAQRLHDGDDYDEVVSDLATALFYITHRSLGMTNEEIDAEWEWDDEDPWIEAAEQRLA